MGKFSKHFWSLITLQTLINKEGDCWDHHENIFYHYHSVCSVHTSRLRKITVLILMWLHNPITCRGQNSTNRSNNYSPCQRVPKLTANIAWSNIIHSDMTPSPRGLRNNIKKKKEKIGVLRDVRKNIANTLFSSVNTVRGQNNCCCWTYLLHNSNRYCRTSKLLVR